MKTVILLISLLTISSAFATGYTCTSGNTTVRISNSRYNSHATYNGIYLEQKFSSRTRYYMGTRTRGGRTTLYKLYHGVQNPYSARLVIQTRMTRNGHRYRGVGLGQNSTTTRSLRCVRN